MEAAPTCGAAAIALCFANKRRKALHARKPRPRPRGSGEKVEDSWYFDLLGANKDSWVWVRVGSDGQVKGRCERSFRYYLDVVEDAKSHGFIGQPKFGQPPAHPK